MEIEKQVSGYRSRAKYIPRFPINHRCAGPVNKPRLLCIYQQLRAYKHPNQTGALDAEHLFGQHLHSLPTRSAWEPLIDAPCLEMDGRLQPVRIWSRYFTLYR